jgi:outer membrane protein TolC
MTRKRRAQPKTQAQSARQAFDETAARERLGAVPASGVRASEIQYWDARVAELRATGQRLTDTALLFQAMGGVAEDKHSGS